MLLPGCIAGPLVLIRTSFIVIASVAVSAFDASASCAATVTFACLGLIDTNLFFVWDRRRRTRQPMPLGKPGRPLAGADYCELLRWAAVERLNNKKVCFCRRSSLSGMLSSSVLRRGLQRRTRSC